MDTSQQHLNVWSSSVNVSTSSPLIATTPSTLLLPAATVPAVVATQAIIANDAPPPLPTYHFVEGSLPRAAFPDKNGSDAQQQQQLQQQRQHQAHHHLRQYAVDQQLFLDGDIANLSESGSGSKFGNNNNNTITTNNTQTLGSPQSGILLHSPTALLATPFVGVQQPNFYVNNNSTTTPTSGSVASSAAGLVTSFAPPIASPATPPGLQQASSSMFSSSGSPGTSLNVATSGTFSATGQGVEDEQLSSTNIFVSHLPAFVDDVALRNLFSRFGPILSSVVMRDIYSGVSRGIAFVEFENETSASDAIASLDKLVMEDKTISVQRGKRFSRGAPTSRVFIRNIPKAVSEAELYDVCSKFGDVSWLSLHADSMRHAGVAGSSGAGSSSDAAAMMALESQLMSTNTTTGGASSSPSSTTTAAAGGKQDRNIAFVTFASKEAASAAAVALHNASPFAGADGVPLLTKVVLDNLPPRRQRKASAAPTTTTNHHHQHQQQQQQNHRQMQPQLHQPSPYGSVAAPPQMFLPQHLLSHHHHQFQRALHSPLTPFNVFHPPQQQQQQQQQGQLHHHSLPNLQGSPQQQHHMHQLHHHQQHAGNFLFLPTDGTTMGTPQLMHNPAPMQLVPQHHQHHHQMNQQQLHPSSTAASSASALLMTSPPSHQFVFATMPQGGQQQQQQQFHPLQSSGSGVGGGPSSSMTHMQGGGAAAMQPASPFQYASPFHSSNGGASFVPIQQQVSDGSSWSSSMMLDPMQHQQQQQQLFHGSTSGASPSSGGVGGGNNPAAMILSPPHTTEVVSMPPAQHMMYWNASSLM